MFPSISSVTRPPPSLIPGSDGTPSPAFHRYYGAATTAVVSRFVLRFFGVGQGGLVVDFAALLVQVGKSTTCTPGVLFSPVAPTSGHWSTRDLRLSQVPREPHCAFAVLSDSGRASVPSLHGTSVLSPTKRTRRTSTTLRLSELYHTASALAVYASCRHYWRRRKTRFRGLASLSRVGFHYPLSSFRKFQPSGFPFHWASLGAIVYSFTPHIPYLCNKHPREILLVLACRAAD